NGLSDLLRLDIDSRQRSIALIECPYRPSTSSQETGAGAGVRRRHYCARCGVDARELGPIGTRHPDLAITVERIVRASRHLNCLTDLTGIGINARKRAALIYDNPNAVLTCRDATLRGGRSNL